MRAAWPYAAVSLVAGLLLLVPWQGNYDRIGAVANVPVPSANPSPAASTVALLRAGAWWRVEPDYSFFLVSHIAAATRADWPLVSPMGPLAFLFRGWLPETAVPLLAAWAAIVILLFVAAWRLARASGLAPPASALWFCALVIVAFPLPRDTILLLAPVLLLGVHFTSGAGPARDTSAVLAAVAALVKASSLAGAVIALAAITIDDARMRRWPRSLAVFSIAFVALYAAVGRSLLDLPMWLVNSVEILRHFGEAWSLGISFRGYAALLTAIVIALSAAHWRHSRTHSIAFALIGMTFVKAGFGRPDEFHLLISRTAVLALLLVGSLRFSRRACAGATAIALFATLPAFSIGESGRQLAAAINPVAAHRASVELFRNEMRGIRHMTPVPPLTGTVDWYDARQCALIASGLDYDPRPVYQGMNVVSSRLENANASHLDGADAPDWLFYEPLAMDGRLPSAEDAASWPVRLARYDVAAVRGDIALLRKRAIPRRWHQEPIQTTTVQLGKTVELPAQEALWMEVDVKPTLRGRAESLLLGLPPLLLEITTPTRALRYRLIPSVARGGFVISPVVRSAAEYAALNQNRLEVLRSSEARSVRLIGDGRSYASQATMRLSRLVIDHTQ